MIEGSRKMCLSLDRCRKHVLVSTREWRGAPTNFSLSCEASTLQSCFHLLRHRLRNRHCQATNSSPCRRSFTRLSSKTVESLEVRHVSLFNGGMSELFLPLFVPATIPQLDLVLENAFLCVYRRHCKQTANIECLETSECPLFLSKSKLCESC